MKYAINPHQHVKIWISSQKDEFLPLMNRLRLSKMRKINQEDEINLFVDSRLLTIKAMNNAKQFCLNHKIQLFDLANIDKFASKLEERLYKLYEQEIFSLGKGGNLGRASDYLRWISAVYRRGIYSDFDVDVDTRECPKFIYADRPILFKIGTVKLDMESTYAQLKEYGIYLVRPDKEYHQATLNNDCIAISEEDSNAIKWIQRFQQALVNAANPSHVSKSIFTRQLAMTLAEFSKKLGEPIAESAAEDLSGFIKQLTNLLMPYDSALFSLIEIEKIINNEFEKVYLRLKEDSEYRKRFENGLRQQFDAQLKRLSDSPVSDESIEYTKKILAKKLEEQDPLAFCQEYIRGIERDMKIKLVTYSSGPRLIQNVLFNDQLLFETAELPSVLFSSFVGYGLNDYFYSANSFPFNGEMKEFIRLLNCEVGEMGDQSWTEEGVKIMAKKEEEIIKDSAITIQRAVRARFFSLPKVDVNQVPDAQEENVIKV